MPKYPEFHRSLFKQLHSLDYNLAQIYSLLKTIDARSSDRKHIKSSLDTITENVADIRHINYNALGNQAADNGETDD